MNVLTVSGNLTRDPELKTTQSAKSVCSGSVAINDGKDKTLFLNFVAWEKTGELIAEYCKKGDKFTASGRLDLRKYEDKNGVEKQAAELVVQSFDFPPKREQSHATGGGHAMTSVHGPVDDFESDSIPF